MSSWFYLELKTSQPVIKSVTTPIKVSIRNSLNIEIESESNDTSVHSVIIEDVDKNIFNIDLDSVIKIQDNHYVLYTNLIGIKSGIGKVKVIIVDDVLNRSTESVSYVNFTNEDTSDVKVVMSSFDTILEEGIVMVEKEQITRKPSKIEIMDTDSEIEISTVDSKTLSNTIKIKNQVNNVDAEAESSTCNIEVKLIKVGEN